MSLMAFVPFLVAIIGLILYVIASKPQVVEVGRILFFVGMFWAVYILAGTTIRIST